MKSFFKLLLAASLLTGLAVSCFDESAVMDKIDGLDSRLSALEQQMQTANANISSLQTIVGAIKNGIVITSITPVEDGYKLVFSDGATATIKNGTDGATPTIGVKQDTDGVYYWTLDGNWLLDAKGNKVRASGEDGKPGADAVAPQLKIEKGNWYLSTDGGATWQDLGKATGEDGDAWFKDVKWDDDYVYLTLADGTVLKLRMGEGRIISIAVIPDYNDGSVKAGASLFTIRFKIVPEDAAESLLDLESKCFRLDAVYTLTKAKVGDLTTLPIHKRTVEDGMLIITTDGSELASEFANKTLGVNAALSVDDGTVALTTGYFPLWPKNEYMGHEYVDLGLESGNMWAETNLGADNPWDVGGHYAWGELEPKSTFSWSNYLWGSGENDLTKYNVVDGKRTLKDYNYEDDAARKDWGGEWRIPTEDDWKELMDKTKMNWVWTYKNGSYGFEVKSKKGDSGQSIFLPVCGLMLDDFIQDDSYGFYWTSNLDYDFAYGCYAVFGMDSKAWYGFAYWGRRAGLCIRPVLGEPKQIPVTGVTLSAAELTLEKGKTERLKAAVEPDNASNKALIWSSGDESVATVDGSGIVTGVGIGTTTITVKTVDGGFTATCTVIVKEPDAPAGSDAVDMGLSIKWAKCNLGAKSEEEYGDYYAWGETEPYYQAGYALADNVLWKPGKEAGYDWPSYRWCTGDWDLITKYNTSSYYGSTIDELTTLESNDDAAAVAIGGGWRMPTSAEWEELMNPNNCEWTWTTSGGVLGYKVTSRKTHESIFLPATGRRAEEILDIDEKEPEDANGYYWSSSLSEYCCNALARCFYNGSQSSGDGWYDEPRCYGLSVRPVQTVMVDVHAVERQWVLEYEDEGQTERDVYDVGFSFPRRLFWKEEPLSSDTLPYDQFEGMQYSLAQLPDGGIKVYTDDPRKMWYTFYDVTETTATIVLYYSSVYYTKEDVFDIRGRYPELDSYGWKYVTINVKARQPAEKLKWEQWVLEVDGYKYRIYGTDYENAGGDQYKFFVNSVLHGQASTVPIVRMNNIGTEADFSKVDVTGKVVVLDRGGVTFSEKYQNASNAGAIGVICVNDREGIINAGLSGVGDNVKKIPFVTVLQEAGERLNGKSSVTFTWCTDPDEIVGY
ncbi:MAG: Ig-like domain-containing protein [Bacteroidales bacterium]|nr:Ig-like domain-containing protein [Bacteroidales bacterium]